MSSVVFSRTQQLVNAWNESLDILWEIFKLGHVPSLGGKTPSQQVKKCAGSD